MKPEEDVKFNMLDVGCGTQPKGDVNVDFFGDGFNPQTGDQIKGFFMTSRNIKNFVMADAVHLPFRDGSFNVAFSSHTIEHIPDPLLMLREMCRVAQRKVIVRCPHRKGSDAVKPYHINHFDEKWFKKASEVLGFKSKQFVISYENPLTPRLNKISPYTLQKSLIWSGLEHFERLKFMKKRKIPSEIEVWIRKKENLTNSEKTRFVVVYDRPQVFADCFGSSSYFSKDAVTAFHNVNGEPLPKFYNKVVQKYLDQDTWLVFCHQDFRLNEDLQSRLKGKEVQAVYGPIGSRPSEDHPLGMIIQTDGTLIGRNLESDTPVFTLDEMCLILHSEAFKQGLSFDERFRFHFYGADLCMQAYVIGLDVMALQLNCQHKSRTLHGDITSPEYLSSLKLFKQKWKQFLPIRTTTKIIT